MKLLDYDTVIFDLDFTIWDGCRPKFWAKLLQPPYYRIENSVYGVGGDSIQLQEGIITVLMALHKAGKKVGFASVGALKNVEFDIQPTVTLLNMFAVFDYFNYQRILLFKTESKAGQIIPNGLTLYIDDADEQLLEVKRIHGDSIDILDRKSFGNWETLL